MSIFVVVIVVVVTAAVFGFLGFWWWVTTRFPAEPLDLDQSVSQEWMHAHSRERRDRSDS